MASGAAMKDATLRWDRPTFDQRCRCYCEASWHYMQSGSPQHATTKTRISKQIIDSHQ